MIASSRNQIIAALAGLYIVFIGNGLAAEFGLTSLQWSDQRVNDAIFLVATLLPLLVTGLIASAPRNSRQTLALAASLLVSTLSVLLFVATFVWIAGAPLLRQPLVRVQSIPLGTSEVNLYRSTGTVLSYPIYTVRLERTLLPDLKFIRVLLRPGADRIELRRIDNQRIECHTSFRSSGAEGEFLLRPVQW